MIRFSLYVCFLFSFLSNANRSFAQVVFYGLTENPALIVHQDALEERNLISSKRVVLMAGDSQTVCIDRIDVGSFDTLIYTGTTFPDDINVVIEENCIKLNAATGAQTGSSDLVFEYKTFSGNSLLYTITVEITQPLQLPFFDDFAYNSKFPDPNRWIDRDVFINTTMAVDPPSVGVATFDGVNSNGTPYGGGFGRADYLTSTYLDLGNINANDRVYLSYYLQPKGNTFNHQLRDSIELEFKNAEGNWEKIVSYKGINPSNPSTYIPPFEQYFVSIDPKYQYTGFQFRFVNHNYRLGVYSTWHLDYVKLIVNQIPTLNQMDIAFMAPPNKILKKYSAIPYKQLAGFEENELATTTEILLFNHFLDIPEDIGNPRLIINEITTGTEIIDKQLVNSVPQLNPPPGINRFSNPFDPSEIADKVKSVPSGNLPLIFRTTYTFDQDQEVPFLEANNAVFTDSEVGYVMAYDDGSAELNIAAEANNSVKSQIAVKFHANVGDTLKAVQFHFPRLFDNVSNQLFNIKVWVGELKEEADYNYQLQRPIYTDAIYDTLQGFTTYPLVNDLTKEPAPLFIPEGDYYVGWQQFTVSSAGQFIPVGFDRNYAGGELLTYYKSTGDWKPLSELSTSPLLKGIPMVRAKFQDAWLTSGSKAIVKDKQIAFYPNPSNGSIWLDKQLTLPINSTYVIYNNIGSRVQTGKVEQQINIANLPASLYYIQVVNADGSLFGTSKIVLVR